MHQINEARYYIGRAENLGHPHLWQSYEAILEFLAHFRGALNAYAKCFVGTGPGRMKLESSVLFSSDHTRAAAHKRLIDLRHKYVAHSDSNEFEAATVVEEPDDKELVVGLQYKLEVPFDRMYELRDLIRFVEEHVVDNQQKHVESVGREIGKPVRIRQGG